MTDTDELVRRLGALAAYIAEEADFNRSWTDGRRGSLWKVDPGYVTRRIELAEERERWAEAAKQAAATIERLRAVLQYGVECRHPVHRSWRISGGENAGPNLREFEVQARAALGMPPRPDPFPLAKFSADDFDAIMDLARNPTPTREEREQE